MDWDNFNRDLEEDEPLLNQPKKCHKGQGSHDESGRRDLAGHELPDPTHHP